MKYQKHLFKLLILFLVFSFQNQVSYAQANPEGHWEGEIEIPGQSLEIQIDLKTDNNKLSGTISIPAQNVKNHQLDQIRKNEDSLKFRIPGVAGSPQFEGQFSDEGNTLSGDFKQSGQAFPFKLTRMDNPVAKAKKALEGFDTLATKGLKDWKVPGMGIAVVYKDELVLSKGYGKRDMENERPVTENTLFAIGSSTKAFTTFTLSTLASEGKLEWNKPVINYLPGFRMHDPVVTRKITPMDLVTHRSGLPRHDLVWYGNQDVSREELVERVRYLPLSADLREKFQYNNLMYLTAGYLTEQLTGKTWEEAVRDRILNPLEMERTNFSVSESQEDEDHAKGYKEEDDEIKPIPFRSINVMGPAGSINSSVEEMSHWMKVQLNSGKYNGKSLVSPAMIENMHQPQMVLNSSSQHKEISDPAYGMGWFIDNYRGHKRVSHGGNIDGFSALVTLFPNDDLGIVILTNKNGTSLPSVLTKHIADKVLELESINWYSDALESLKKGKQASREAQKKKEATRKEGTSTSHELESYAGTYEHPGYGGITVQKDGKQLSFTYHDIKTPLQHWHYDVFNGKKAEDPVFQDMKLQFKSNLDGYIDEVSIPLESSVDPITFTKQPDERFSDASYLEKFTGKYFLVNDTIRVTLAGNHLQMKVPGQPQYTLVPALGNRFKLKEYTIISISFRMNDQGKPIELISDQPNGRFVAKRVDE